mmetsp:Transcript_13130/g.18146  ORF Transcript_13130/g.18146 Transcript_13130/m.18146 type:complete len:109 (+) Transcript_13130:496-822(+)
MNKRLRDDVFMPRREQQVVVREEESPCRRSKCMGKFRNVCIFLIPFLGGDGESWGGVDVPAITCFKGGTKIKSDGERVLWLMIMSLVGILWMLAVDSNKATMGRLINR